MEDEDEVGFLYGMNAFLRREDQQAFGTLHRAYSFNDSCVYGAIQAGHRQIQLIDDFNRQFGKAVYYLLYNPHEMPLTVNYPLGERIRVEDNVVGCRVLDADQVHGCLADLPEGKPPSYAAIKAAGEASNWPLETWAADLLLTCNVGEQFDDTRDDRVRYLLERRSGPIGAAIAASITLPDAG